METVNRDKFTCFFFFLQDAVTLCSYPFIFDAQAKTKMLQTDAELQMQVILLSLNFPAPCLLFLPFALVLARRGVHWELVCAAFHYFHDTGEQSSWRAYLSWILQRQCLMFGNIRTATCACCGNLNYIGKE